MELVARFSFSPRVISEVALWGGTGGSQEHPTEHVVWGRGCGLKLVARDKMAPS